MPTMKDKTDKQIDDAARLAHPKRVGREEGFDAGWAAKGKIEERAYSYGFEDGANYPLPGDVRKK
jgi:ABC-type proline/glycine betaine transport system substrate-binding protein